MEQRPPFSESLAVSHTQAHTLTHTHTHPHNAYTAHPHPSHAQKHTHTGMQRQKHLDSLSFSFPHPTPAHHTPSPFPLQLPCWEAEQPSEAYVTNLVGWCHLTVIIRNAPPVPRIKRNWKGPRVIESIPLQLTRLYPELP